MDQRIKDIADLLAENLEHFVQFVQGFGALTISALLLVPVLIAALARKAVLTLASVLLSVVSLMLIISPASPTSVLGVAGGFASFLIALGSIYERRRTTALRRLHEEIEGLTERTGRLEAGEQRRMLLELRTRKISPKPQGDEHIQTGG